MDKHTPSAVEIAVDLARENERLKMTIEQLHAEIGRLQQQLDEERGKRKIRE